MTITQKNHVNISYNLKFIDQSVLKQIKKLNGFIFLLKICF